MNIIIVEKSGSLKELALKTFDENELYKKAGFKSADGFKLQTDWGANVSGKQYQIFVYGKTNGRAGQENKYEFPPPIDNTLFFGSCLLVNKSADGKLNNLTKNEWKNIYEYLYGGFEDLGDEDTDDDSEGEGEELVPRTKEGYVKDGFVVDDAEGEDESEEGDDEDDESYEETSEEEIVQKKKTTRATTKPKTPATKKTKETISEKPQTVFETANYLDCTSELSEEEYI